MLLRGRFGADLNLPHVLLLDFPEIIAHKQDRSEQGRDQSAEVATVNLRNVTVGVIQVVFLV
jgi:hypothetical protein